MSNSVLLLIENNKHRHKTSSYTLMSFHAVKNHQFLMLVKGNVQCMCALLKLCPNVVEEDNGSTLRAE